MTYRDLHQILTEAEQRRDDPNWPENIRQNSAETVALCEQRLLREGMTREQLQKLAFREGR
jgi:hypothetical protein